jgi:polar amino acid transport system substrate-binding protein
MRRMTLVLGVIVAVVALGGATLGAAFSATPKPKFGKCKPTGKFGSVKLKKTVSKSTLTVGFVSLSPRTYKGNTPSKVNDGFNYCLAANIAWRAGLTKIKLTKTDFAQLVAGRLSGFDIAMDDIYIKPEREAKIDFSIPYGESWTGLVGRTDQPLTKDGLKDLRFAVTLGSVQQKWLDEVLKPNQQLSTFDDPATMFAALRAKQVDAVLIDLPVALPAVAESGGDFKAYAQVKVGGTVGIVMMQGTPNRAAINKMVKQLKANGTLLALEKKYYFTAYGGIDPHKLPYWG